MLCLLCHSMTMRLLWGALLAAQFGPHNCAILRDWLRWAMTVLLLLLALLWLRLLRLRCCLRCLLLSWLRCCWLCLFRWR